jgi:hypothetical protein
VGQHRRGCVARLSEGDPMSDLRPHPSSLAMPGKRFVIGVPFGLVDGVLFAAVPDPALHQLRGHGWRHPPLQAAVGFADRRAPPEVRKLLDHFQNRLGRCAVPDAVHRGLPALGGVCVCHGPAVPVGGVSVCVLHCTLTRFGAPSAADAGDVAVLDIVFVARVRVEGHPGRPGRAQPTADGAGA